MVVKQVWDEPYPSLIMPAFSGTAGLRDGEMTRMKPVLTWVDAADQTERWVLLSGLYGDVPRSMRAAFVEGIAPLRGRAETGWSVEPVSAGVARGLRERLAEHMARAGTGGPLGPVSIGWVERRFGVLGGIELKGERVVVRRLLPGDGSSIGGGEGGVGGGG